MKTMPLKGKRRWHVRLDCFERETESGTTTGAGWLRLVEVTE